MARNSDPYLALGVRPIINCCAVRTLYGGSLMLPQVKDAMAQASRQFVHLDELMEAAGRRPPELTPGGWGRVPPRRPPAPGPADAAPLAPQDPAQERRPALPQGQGKR